MSEDTNPYTQFLEQPEPAPDNPRVGNPFLAPADTNPFEKSYGIAKTDEIDRFSNLLDAMSISERAKSFDTATNDARMARLDRDDTPIGSLSGPQRLVARAQQSGSIAGIPSDAPMSFNEATPAFSPNDESTRTVSGHFPWVYGIYGDSFDMMSLEEKVADSKARRQETLEQIGMYRKYLDKANSAVEALKDSPVTFETGPFVALDSTVEYNHAVGLRDTATKKLAELYQDLKRYDIIEKDPRRPGMGLNKGMVRTAVENASRALVDTAITSVIRMAGVAAGYAGKRFGMDIGPDDNAIYRAGETIAKMSEEMFPGDVARQEDFSQKLAQGAGSMAAFMGTGALGYLLAGPKAGNALLALSGGINGSDQQFQEASQAILKAKRQAEDTYGPIQFTPDERDRMIATGFGFLLGLSEVVPFVGKAQGAGLRGVAGNAGRQAVEEAIQEGGMTAGSNVVARYTYDPTRDLSEGVGEGAAVGFVLGGMVGGMTGYRRAPEVAQPGATPDAPGVPTGGGIEIPAGMVQPPERPAPESQGGAGNEPPFGAPEMDGIAVAGQPTRTPSQPVEYADPETGEQMPPEDVETIVEMWRYVQEQRGQRKPQTLSKWIVEELGRVQDQNGELSNILGGAGQYLISGKGRTLDDAALAAWEAGFFPGTERPDVRTFLEAIDQDVRTGDVIRTIDFELADNKQAADQMAADLEQMGVYSAKSEDEIRNYFRRPQSGAAAAAGAGQQEQAATIAKLTSYLDGGGSLAKSQYPVAARALGVRESELTALLDQAVSSGALRKVGNRYRRTPSAAPRTPQAVVQTVDEVIKKLAPIIPKGTVVKSFADLKDLPPGTRARLTQSSDGIVDPASGQRVDAFEQGGTIYLAQYALDKEAKLTHEVVHALVTKGLISPAEVALLANRARKAGLFPKELEDKYRAAYKGRANLDAQVDEEAAAALVESRAAGASYGQKLDTILDRILAFFKQLGQLLRRRGYRTAEEVVDGFFSGELARRRAVQPRPDEPMFSLVDRADLEMLAAQNNAVPLRDWSPNDTNSRVLAFHGSERGGPKAGDLFYTDEVYFSGSPESADQYARTYSQLGSEPNYAPRAAIVASIIDVDGFAFVDLGEYVYAKDNGDRLNNEISTAKKAGFKGLVYRAQDVAGWTINTPNLLPPEMNVVTWTQGTVTSATARGEPMFALGDLADRNNAKLIDDIGPNDPHPGRVLALHGTMRTFERFDPNRTRDGFVHFGTLGQSERFTGLGSYMDEGRQIPVVLDLDRVIDVPDLMTWPATELAEVVEAKVPDAVGLTERVRNTIRNGPTYEGFDGRRRPAPEALDDAKRYLKEELTRLAIDGLRYRNDAEGEGWSYMVWEPGKVRSAVSEQVMFALADREAGQSMRRDFDALGYYSQALEAAKALKQAKGTPEQMLAQLKAGGAKQNEIEATGLLKFLGLEQGSDGVVRRGDPLSSSSVAPYKTYKADPTTLLKREQDQNNLPAIRELFPQGEGYFPAIVIRTADGVEILDGHNRATVAAERGDKLPVVEISDAQYRAAKRVAGDDTDVAHAALVMAGEDDAASSMRQKFPGTNMLADVYKIVDALESAPQQKAKPRTVTRDEIVAHLEANRVGVKQSQYGTPELRPGTMVLTAEQLAARDGLTASKMPLRFYAIDDDGRPLGGGSTYENAANLILAKRAKWNTHSLDPSNPTYRETVLHLPSRYDVAKAAYENQNLGKLYDDVSVIDRSEFEKNLPGDFQSGHFPERNIVGHMMTSMTKHEGKPVYTVDQIQSDWGQKLRDGGVRDEAKIAELKARFETARSEYDRIEAEEDAVGFAVNPLDQVPYPRTKPYGPKTQKAYETMTLLQAEYRTAKASVSGNPLVNTTDQWTNTTLRRAIRQAAEADADYIAIPHGDTVLSYNFGDDNGMAGFYGTRTSEGIVPKNLRKLLEKIDRNAAKPIRVTELETPSGTRGYRDDTGNAFDKDQTGFTLFPLTDAVKQSVIEDGLPMFAFDRGLDMSPEARKKRAEEMGFDTGTVYYHGSPDFRGVKSASQFEKRNTNRYNRSSNEFEAAPQAIYFTPDRSIASTYADDRRAFDYQNAEPEIFASYLRLDNMLEINAGGQKFSTLDRMIVKMQIPEAQRTEFDRILDRYGSSTDGKTIKTGDLELVANMLGYDGFRLSRVKDAYDGGGKPTTVIAIFDPKNIRSVNAAFDPAEFDSPNLMFAQQSPDVKSLQVIATDLARDLDLVVRPGLSKTATGRAAKRAGLASLYDPATGVIRVQSVTDIQALSEAAADALRARFGQPMQDVLTANAAELLPNAQTTVNVQGSNGLSYEVDTVARTVMRIKTDPATGAKTSTDITTKPNAVELLADADKQAARSINTAFRTWFRDYLISPSLAEANAPTLFDEVEAFLDQQDPTLVAKLNSTQEAIQAYYQADPARFMESVVRDATKPGLWATWNEQRQLFGVRGAISIALNKLYTATVAGKDQPFATAVREVLRIYERNTGTKLDLTAAENPAAGIRLAPHTHAWAARDMEDGIRPYDGIDPRGPALIDALVMALGTDRATARDVGPGSNYRKFGSYLVAKYAAVEWGRFRDGTKPAAPTAMPPGAANPDQAIAFYERVAQTYEASNPEFAQAASLIYDFQQELLTLQFKAGFIGQEKYDELMQDRTYVPFYRAFDEDADLSSRALGSGPNGLLKRKRGSDRDIIDPIAGIAQKVFETRQAISLNDVKKNLLRIADQAGPGGGVIAERIDAKELKGQNIDIEQALESAARDAGVDPRDKAEMMDVMRQVLGNDALATYYTQKIITPGKDPIVFFFEAGEVQAMRLGDGEHGHKLAGQMFEVLNTFGKAHLDTMIEIAALPAQTTRLGVTTHPEFAAANLVRDAVMAFQYDPKATPFYTQLKGMVDVARGAEYVKGFYRTAGMMGGEGTSYADKFRMERDIRGLVDRGYTFKLIDTLPNLVNQLQELVEVRNWRDRAAGGLVGAVAGAAVGGPVGAVTGGFIGATAGAKTLVKLGEVSETATRARLWKHGYDRAIDQGLDPVAAGQEAAFWAHDYTDYSRRGSKMDGLAAVIPFLNSNIQGNDVYIRRLLGKGDQGYNPGILFPLYRAGILDITKLSPKEQQELGMSAWTWAMTVFGLGSISAVIATLWDDDERLKDIDNQVKAGHWLIPVGDTIYRVPKPFQTVWFSQIIERWITEGAKGNPRWFEYYLEDLWSTWKPPVVPAVAEVVGTMTGYDVNSGRTIMPAWSQDKSVKQQFDAYTSPFAKWAGPQMNISPFYVDHVIHKFGATWGRTFTSLNVPGTAWYDPRKPEKGPEEEFISRRFMWQVGRGSEAGQALREMMGSDKPLKLITGLLSAPYSKYATSATDYRSLIEKPVPDHAGAVDRLKTMTDKERGFALLEGHFRAPGEIKYRLLHPMNRAERVARETLKIEKEIIGDELLTGKKGKNQKEVPLSPSEKKAARDILTQYRMMEMHNALVLTKETGWERKMTFQVKSVLEELKVASPATYKEMMTRFDKAGILKYDGVAAAWPKFKEKLEDPKWVERVRKNRLAGVKGMFEADYQRARSGRGASVTPAVDPQELAPVE